MTDMKVPSSEMQLLHDLLGMIKNLASFRQV